jgi:ABC-type tungstate transport system substrate-binding protein
MGEFDLALALWIILLSLTFLANSALFCLQRRGEV